MDSKNIKQQKKSKLRTEKSILGLLCFNLYYSVSKLQLNNIRFWKTTRIWIWILFGSEKTTWIWILFGLKISSEHEYEYRYSVSTIWILFEYRIIRSPLILFNQNSVWNLSDFECFSCHWLWKQRYCCEHF